MPGKGLEMKNFIACLTVSALSGATFADIINVPGDYTSIQDAIDVSNNGDTIMIAGGLYYEYSINPGGKLITLEGATDTGGLPVTTIDAQQKGRVILCDSGETDNTVFKNLVITGGHLVANGAGIYIHSNPTFENCIITGNVATQNGGGVYNDDGSNPSFTNCILSNNTAVNSGGGMHSHRMCPMTITNCTFDGNTSEFGGGMYIYRSQTTTTLNSCHFINNSANQGGGFYKADYCSTNFYNCSFLNNTAVGDGGGILISHGGGSQTFANCLIENNSADGGGGGVYTAGGGTISDCNITNNQANGFGGGINVSQGSISVSGTTVCGNDAPQIVGKWDDNGENVLQTICDALDGACCNNDKCFLLTQEDCETMSGDWQGYGVLCEDVNCVQPPAFGACCINGEALALYDYDCDRILGTFMGEGTNPDDVTCPTHCAEDITGDGVVDVSDLLAIIAVWGACP